MVFVCTANSARSQLAAARWNAISPVPAASAGTHPAARVHPRATATGRRHGLRLGRVKPVGIEQVLQDGDLVVAVCDNVHEELDPGQDRLHWSIPDPVRVDTDEAFETAYADITRRVERLAATVTGPALHRTRPEPADPRWRESDEHDTDHHTDLEHAEPGRIAGAADARRPGWPPNSRGSSAPRRSNGSCIPRSTSSPQRATVVKFLPLMAERFARQRLRALAKVEGLHDDGKPTVLFLCVHNAGRSQMAMGFFTALAGDHAVAWSGGSEPGIEVNPAAIAAMAERGIDISAEFPKPWTDETVRAADVVITMGCGDACPIFPGKRYEEWVLDDPAGSDVARRPTRPGRDRTPGPEPARRTQAARGHASAGQPDAEVTDKSRSRAAPARQDVSQTDTDPQDSHTLTRAGSASTDLILSTIPVTTTPARRHRSA